MPGPHVLGQRAMNSLHRGVWAVSICIYLGVFASGLHGGGSDLVSMGRAAAFAVCAALLGRITVGLLGRSRLPDVVIPMATQDRPVGSLVDLLSPTTVAQLSETAPGGQPEEPK